MSTLDRKFTLVCANDPEPWNRLSLTHAVITIRNAAVMIAAVDQGFHEGGKDIQRVVFDRSIDAAEFLSVLTQLPYGFRGDVLFTPEEGQAFLSAVSPRGDGRALFSLSKEDVNFYLEAVFEEGEQRPHEAAHRFIDAA
ncbi:MAG TPA: hypothetical protein VIL97_08885 [Thermoanaerobaculia bacterium]